MDSYQLLKSLHIIGVVLFIGNIIVTGWWKVMADRTRHPAIIAFAQRQVTATDWVFTFGGSMLVGTAGLLNAWINGLSLSQAWILWGSALFGLSAVVWLVFLLPIQTKLSTLTRGFDDHSPIPDRYWQLEKWWLFWGTVATLLPLAVIPIMVFKVG